MKNNITATASNAKLERGAYCQYDPSLAFESASGGLRLFLPCANGYVNYNLVHSVNSDRNCDTWRLGQAYAWDDAFKTEYELTPVGAEWDMALRLSDRPDFIGGYAHGDEIYNSLSMHIDEKNVDMESVQVLTQFRKIVIAVTSIGYDPNDSETPALKHVKEYIIDENGITLNQTVEWLNGYTLGSSYMAMMPPLKTLTDSFYTDVDPTPKEASANFGYVLGAAEAAVYGSGSGIVFSMAVPKYPRLLGGERFLLTDNSGKSYHKMYFVLCNGAQVVKGDTWETTTVYRITKGGI